MRSALHDAKTQMVRVGTQPYSVRPAVSNAGQLPLLPLRMKRFRFFNSSIQYLGAGKTGGGPCAEPSAQLLTPCKAAWPWKSGSAVAERDGCLRKWRCDAPRLPGGRDLRRVRDVSDRRCGEGRDEGFDCCSNRAGVRPSRK